MNKIVMLITVLELIVLEVISPGHTELKTGLRQVYDGSKTGGPDRVLRRRTSTHADAGLIASLRLS